jgi:hypothetical protein
MIGVVSYARWTPDRLLRHVAYLAERGQSGDLHAPANLCPLVYRGHTAALPM